MIQATSPSARPGPNIVCDVVELSAFDIFDCVRQLQPTDDYMLWRDREHRSYLAVGRALSVAHPAGASTAVGLGDLMRMLARKCEAAGLDDASAVRAFASVSFDPGRRHADGGDWSSVPAMELRVPEILIEHDDEGQRAVLIGSPEQIPLLVGRLERLCEAADDPPTRLLDAEVPDERWDDATYRRQVEQALEALAGDGLEKVVIARALDVVSSSAFDVPSTLRELAERYPRCFIFAKSAATDRARSAPVFLGASPERLARVDGQTLMTGALAGSAPRGKSQYVDATHGRALLDSQKDHDEHQLVTRMIVESLRPIVGSLEVDEHPRLLKLANVQHLLTPVRAELSEGCGIADVVDVLHPTPAVGGTPRDEAMRVIERLEPFERGLYTGAIGWMDLAGDGDFAVAIRCGLVGPEHARLYAGAGIVPASAPELEAEETRTKLAAMLESLREMKR